MRHRIKKIPTLSKLSHICNHLLHSDKSTYTYFYKGKVKSLLYSNKISTIPLVLSAFGLLLVLGLSVGCVGGNKAAYAETVTEEQCNSETKLALSLNGVTGDSVSLSKTVDDDIASGSISKVSQDFNVIACMVRNYKLYVQAESSLLKNSSVPDALYGVGDNVAESDFNENTWGYNVAPKGSTSTTYNTVPELTETIPEAYTGNASTSNTGQDFTITFAAKFGNDKAAGSYHSDILLSMVAEPRGVTTLNDIDTMQEMTSEVCDATTIGGTKQLEDTRINNDGKTRTYWVAKLADENCWMAQNLDLDLKSGTSLTPADSDVTSNWDPKQTTIMKDDLNTSTWPGPKDTNNVTKDEANIIRSYDSEDTIYGNYYSWTAAKAGSTDTEPDTSICPKGWRLPTGGNEGEFKVLNNIYPKGTDYGDSDGPTNPGWDSTNQGAWFGGVNTASGGAFFPASGYVGGSGLLNNAGSNGRYWSSIAVPSLYARILSFGSSNVGAGNNGPYRYLGNSVRCVAR